MDFHFVPSNVQILHKFTQPKPKLLKDQKVQPQGNDLLINLLILRNFVRENNQSINKKTQCSHSSQDQINVTN